MAADYAGKRADVIDFGGEMDYADMEWFQDRPPRQSQVPMPPQAQHPHQQHQQHQQQQQMDYTPSQHVIEQNDGFQYALFVAPNVLLQRYKQFGQLGVLGWCAEFGELIDHLKELGFAGNMFVATRTQALQTCEQILSMKLEDVKMQLIVMFLSTQVARLRKFLDAERIWNDYPEMQIPLEPSR